MRSRLRDTLRALATTKYTVVYRRKRQPSGWRFALGSDAHGAVLEA